MTELVIGLFVFIIICAGILFIGNKRKKQKEYKNTRLSAREFRNKK